MLSHIAGTIKRLPAEHRRVSRDEDAPGLDRWADAEPSASEAADTPADSASHSDTENDDLSDDTDTAETETDDDGSSDDADTAETETENDDLSDDTDTVDTEAGDNSSSNDADTAETDEQDGETDAVLRDDRRRGSSEEILQPSSRSETVELGVELLASMGDEELSVKTAVDRIESLTTDPAVTREILDTAETRGVIDRADATIQTTGGTPIRFERRVFTRDGSFDCRRCGASISTGYFVRFDTGDLGPFGSSCIEKVTGRD